MGCSSMCHIFIWLSPSPREGIAGPDLPGDRDETAFSLLVLFVRERKEGLTLEVSERRRASVSRLTSAASQPRLVSKIPKDRTAAVHLCAAVRRRTAAGAVAQPMRRRPDTCPDDARLGSSRHLCDPGQTQSLELLEPQHNPRPDHRARARDRGAWPSVISNRRRRPLHVGTAVRRLL